MSIQETAALLGSFGEFVGAIAVVVTLIYLAAQVKLSKEATEANTRQMEENRKLALVENYMRRSERVEGGYRDNALSDEMSRLLHTANTDFDSLTAYDRYRLREWAHAHMHRLDAQHYQYQHGLLDEESYQNLRSAIARQVFYWSLAEVRAPRASFQAEIDEILREEQAKQSAD